MATSSRTKSAPVKLIYIGPNLRGAKLLKYQVFMGGYPNYLDKEFAECPNLKKLFIPVAELSAAMAQTEKAGTPLHKYYNEAMEV